MPGTGSRKGNGRFLRTISNYSYEVFLVHHIIIYFITPRAIPYMRGMVGVLGLFLVELLLMAVLGFLLKFISDQCIAALSNLTAVEINVNPLQQSFRQLIQYSIAVIGICISQFHIHGRDRTIRSLGQVNAHVSFP